MELWCTESLLIEAVSNEARQVETQVKPLVPDEDRVWDSGVSLRANDVPNSISEDDSLFMLIKCQIYLRLHFACRELISRT